MSDITVKSRTLKGGYYQNWFNKYKDTINKCAVNYREQNVEIIKQRAKNKYHSDPEYKKRRLAMMKIYRDKKKKEKLEKKLKELELQVELEKKKVEQETTE